MPLKFYKILKDNFIFLIFPYLVNFTLDSIIWIKILYIFNAFS